MVELNLDLRKYSKTLVFLFIDTTVMVSLNYLTIQYCINGAVMLNASKLQLKFNVP